MTERAYNCDFTVFSLYDISVCSISVKNKSKKRNGEKNFQR